MSQSQAKRIRRVIRTEMGPWSHPGYEVEQRTVRKVAIPNPQYIPPEERKEGVDYTTLNTLENFGTYTTKTLRLARGTAKSMYRRLKRSMK